MQALKCHGHMLSPFAAPLILILPEFGACRPSVARFTHFDLPCPNRIRYLEFQAIGPHRTRQFSAVPIFIAFSNLMKTSTTFWQQLVVVLAFTHLLGGALAAQDDAVRKALSYAPVQPGVQFDQPEDDQAAKCELVRADKIGESGFVLVDENGQVLRMFLNKGGDRNVDQWSYFRDGVEVYRDVDSDFDGKADQFRWFGFSGTRWGEDTDGDNQIDRWKNISPEEVSVEIVESIRERNPKRFDSLLLTDDELRELGLSENMQAAVQERVEQARKEFLSMARGQKIITQESRWIHFGGVLPARIPAGTSGAKRDVTFYENVAAVVQTGEQTEQISVGTLVQVGPNVWKTIDLPQPIDAEMTLTASAFFMPDDRFMTADTGPNTQLSEANQQLFDGLQTIDEKLEEARQSNSGRQLQTLNAQRAQQLEKIVAAIDDAEEKSSWIRQYADTVSGAYQNGEFDDGLVAVKEYYEQLRDDKVEKADLGYLLYRMISSRYSRLFADAKQDEINELQQKYLQDLERFVDLYPSIEQSADAMLQLALWAEFSTEDKAKDAIAWYQKIQKLFPESEPGKISAGAITRLQSEGKRIAFSGPLLGSNRNYDLTADRGKVVLLNFWDSNSEIDFEQLVQVYEKYSGKGFRLINVNLDSSERQAREVVEDKDLPGVHLHDAGGKRSELSTQLGIALVPTMILVDREGKVADRNVQIADLEKSVDRVIR